MMTFPFVCCYLLLFYFLNKIVLYEENLLYFSALHEFIGVPHTFLEYPINCYIVRGWFFLDSYLSFAKSTAIFDPIYALLSTNEMFDAKLLPWVSSFTLFNKNGVVLAPFIPCYSAYLKACWMAFSINYPSAGLLFGTETRQPFFSPSLCF